MKSLRIKNNLLVTELNITYKGKQFSFENVVVSTTALHTVLSSNAAEKVGIIQIGRDSLFHTVDAINVGPLKVIDFPLEVRDLSETESDGILGLDFLKKVGAKINLDSMTLSGSRIS